MPLMFTDNAIKSRLEGGCAVRGTGIHGVKCTYLMQKSGIDIRYYLSRNKCTGIFRGKKVYGENVDGLYIIVATSPEVYLEIADELRKSGKREFEDFAYYEWFFKDIVLLQGNCHMTVIKKFLLSSSEFRDRYVVYPYPLLVTDTKEFRTEPEIFRHIDVWIHQDIRANNQFGYEVSDDYIRPFVRPEIREIIIPHMYGIGRMLFPQSIALEGNPAINDGNDTDGLFPYGDKVIEKCIESGMDQDEIIAFCRSDRALEEAEIKENFNTHMNKLKMRESQWDIKIANFVEEHYRKEKLFYDDGHPTNVVMKQIVVEILKRLNIKDSQIDCDMNMDTREVYVYPVVRKTLGLEWEDQEVRITGMKLDKHMDFEEYIKEYCWWRHEDEYL